MFAEASTVLFFKIATKVSNVYIFSMVSFQSFAFPGNTQGPPRHGTPERPFRVNLVGQQADQVGPDGWDNRLNSVGCNGTGQQQQQQQQHQEGPQKTIVTKWTFNL